MVFRIALAVVLVAGCGNDGSVPPPASDVASADAAEAKAPKIAGRWRATLASPGGELPFSLKLEGDGTDAPGSRLHVSENQNGATFVSVTNTTNGTSALAGFDVGNGSKGIGFTYRSAAYTDDVTLADTGVLRTDSTVAGGISLRTGGVNPLKLGTNDVDRVYISGAGNVGINNAAPEQILDIVGSMFISIAPGPPPRVGRRPSRT